MYFLQELSRSGIGSLGSFSCAENVMPDFELDGLFAASGFLASSGDDSVALEAACSACLELTPLASVVFAAISDLSGGYVEECIGLWALRCQISRTKPISVG